MLIRGRSRIAAFMACALLLFVSTAAYPSYETEAGRKYAVASQRFADLKKSSKKKKYRSYWIDCIRTFELVEKKYSKSPVAADASFDRAAVYQELYQYNQATRDIEEALRSYDKFQSSHPTHPRAPEALYRIVEISLDMKRENAAAEAYTRLDAAYPGNAWTERAKALISPVPGGKRKREREPQIRRTPAPVIAAAGKATPVAVVKSIRHWSEGAYSRIVIDQRGAVRFQARELKNPDRLVFDLLHTRIGASLSKEPIQINDGILRQVRASQHAPGVVRVVLDLASIKSYAAFPLHDPERLVIDVTGEGGKYSEALTSAPETSTEQQAESAETATATKVEPQRQISPIPQMPEVKNNDGAKLSLSSQLGLKIQTIAIDAGHGGHDPGAIGRSGLKEKTITLDIAKRLAALVKDRLGCKVVMTRDTDVFIPLDQRPFIAKSHDADLFVSIHVNANRKNRSRGIETYIQSLRPSDREAMATAARENAMSTKKLSELKTEVEKILEALDRDNKLEDSLQLAHAVQGSLVDTMRPAQPRIVNLGVKRAFFYVLMNTKMPSILAEVGFISNPEEEKLLRKEAYRQKIAEALYQGVKRFIDARSPQVAGL
jgi:N-acetylmuramoyl-L-alanine amidase